MDEAAEIEALEAEEDEAFTETAHNKVLTGDDIRNLVNSLRIDRIRRAMMLFDIRWLNTSGEAIIPDEDEIRQFAGDLITRTIITGRTLGTANVRDRSFSCLFAYSPIGNEMIGIQYILTGASNWGDE